VFRYFQKDSEEDSKFDRKLTKNLKIAAALLYHAWLKVYSWGHFFK